MIYGGPLLIETVQLPSTTTQYIQLHRLSGNENLSHLLLVYHHYGAAKAVIFVNTSNELKLSQDLLSTFPVSSKILCFIISKSAGTNLISNFGLLQSIDCEIRFADKAAHLLPWPPEMAPQAYSQDLCLPGTKIILFRKLRHLGVSMCVHVGMC